MGAITSFKAVKADTFEVVFDKAQPADVTATIVKNATEQPGAWSWSEDRKTATFKGTARFSNGEYELTVKKGESSVTAKATIEDEKANEIKILCDTILTGSLNKNATSCDNKEGYIYYQVLNQYGEDITSKIDVNWTISSSTVTNVEPSKGKITIASTGDAFRYGTDIMIVGVYATDNVIVQETRKIGMEQCIATVEAKGFVNYKNATINEAVPTLPKNFAKDTWSMVYEAKDQNGMLLDAKEYDNKEITFISNNPLLLQSDFEKDKLYTLKDKETGITKQYASVKVKPGDYADQGGEVTIMAISSKAGVRKEFNITIGEAPRLKTLEIMPPAIVTDGQINVPLNYTAKDVNGNDVTSYETIVRSSNTLSLSASTGTLRVSEDNNGKAVITWSDDTENVTYKDSRSHDNIARMVSLTTVVVGGESRNIMLNVKDKRRPVGFKKVSFGLDGNDSMVIGNSSETNFFNNDHVTYIDQYGDDMNAGDAKTFFNTAFTEFDGDRYCLRVKTNDGTYLNLAKDKIYGFKRDSDQNLGDNNGANNEQTNNEQINIIKNMVEAGHSGEDQNTWCGNAKVGFNAVDKRTEDKPIGELETDNKAGTTTVTYSIATIGTSGIVDKGNTFVATYNTVPQGMVTSNVEAAPNKSKYQMLTSNSNNANGSYLDEGCFVVTPGAAGLLPVQSDDKDKPNTLKLTGVKDDKDGVKFTVKGKARRLNNISLTLPESCYNINDTKSEIIDAGDAYAVSQGAIGWSELYNDNDAKRIRRDARKTLVLNIFNRSINNPEPVNTVETSLAVSDALSYPVKFNRAFGYKVNPTATVLKPENDLPWWDNKVEVLDQYGDVVDKSNYVVNYNITLTEEAQTDDTHLNGSLEVAKNNTNATTIRGAEIGDKCKIITNVVLNGGRTIAFSKEDNITVGSDTLAWISNHDNDHDKNWRKSDTYGTITKPENYVGNPVNGIYDAKGNDGLGLGMNR